MEPWVIVLLVIAGLFALWLAIKLFAWALVGALHLLAFAGEQGFLGLAAYVACWVFFFPVMLVISIIVGIVAGANVRANERILRERERLATANLTPKKRRKLRHDD